MARIVFEPGWHERITADAETLNDQLAEEVADEARRLAPVRTGRLRESIHAEGGKVVADAPYSGYVEMGTRYMNAEPFLRPALYRERG